jgi:hypothetical protein
MPIAHGTRYPDLDLPITPPHEAHPTPLTYPRDHDTFSCGRTRCFSSYANHLAYISAPHIDCWCYDHARDLNAPAWQKWANRYSEGILPHFANDFMANAMGWALHRQNGVDRDATRLRGEILKVRPLAACSILSRFPHSHATTRIANVAANHLGPLHRSVFTKAGIERAIHTTRLGYIFVKPAQHVNA